MKLHELFTESMLTEAPLGFAISNKISLEFLKQKLVGQSLGRARISDPASEIMITNITQPIADSYSYRIKCTKYDVTRQDGTTVTWHPMSFHKEYSDEFLKKITKMISKGTRVDFEHANQQSPGSIALEIFIKAEYPPNYVGGLLKHIKDGTFVMINEKAKEPLKQAAEVINRYVLDKNKNSLECQEELMDGGLKEFAKM